MAANDCTVTDHSDPGRRPKFSREVVLYWLNGIDEQLENVASVATAGIAYQEQLTEEAKDLVSRDLLRVIKQEAEGRQVMNELRRMQETLPMEANHG